MVGEKIRADEEIFAHRQSKSINWLINTLLVRFTHITDAGGKIGCQIKAIKVVL